MTRTLIHSARLVSGGVAADDAWVLLSGDRVEAVGAGPFPDAADGSAEVVDANGALLVPGFIDIHCHGGGTASFDDGPDAVATALAVHRAHRTTRSVLSLVTASVDDLVARAGMVADLADADPLIVGSHLEGPFLDVGHKGAHTPGLLVDPTPERVARLIEAARGTLSQVTIAPELPGGIEAVRTFREAGAVVAIGHTDADYETARAAFDAGATLLTHAFNAMNGLHHRAPGPVAAATEDERVALEIINDGTHVHHELVRMLFASAPGRMVMVSDAMAAAGAADGAYELGGLAVTVTDGVARLAEGGSIAGSTLTLDDALRRAVTDVGVPVEDAVDALTRTPARVIGRGADLGLLAPGYAADAVLLSRDFAVEAVWAAGERVA